MFIRGLKCIIITTTIIFQKNCCCTNTSTWKSQLESNEPYLNHLNSFQCTQALAVLCLSVHSTFVLFYCNVFLWNHVTLSCQVYFLSWHSVEIMCVSRGHMITLPLIVAGWRWELWKKKKNVFAFSLSLIGIFLFTSTLLYAFCFVCQWSLHRWCYGLVLIRFSVPDII